MNTPRTPTLFDELLSRHAPHAPRALHPLHPLRSPNAPHAPRTTADAANTLREVMQQITLAGLWRGGFFAKAAFYGGTCLRLFHAAERFSEDMDFSLLAPDENFSLETYFDAITTEFKSLGRDVVISKKEKKRATNVESAFLKDDTSLYNLHFKSERKVKIKIEVDIRPPPGFSTEQKLSLQPFSFMTRCYTLPDLYAGKMHALLFRAWQKRVKGRDWWDWEWYVRKNVPLNLGHLGARICQFNPAHPIGNLTREKLLALLRERIRKTDIEAAKADVRPFIQNAESLEIWTKDYFRQLAEKIRFVE